MTFASVPTYNFNVFLPIATKDIVKNEPGEIGLMSRRVIQDVEAFARH